MVLYALVVIYRFTAFFIKIAVFFLRIFDKYTEWYILRYMTVYIQESASVKYVTVYIKHILSIHVRYCILKSLLYYRVYLNSTRYKKHSL